MRVLLDAAMPHVVRLEPPGHDISTVQYLGWAHYRNDDLIRHAVDAGFDVCITPERGIQHQHNIPRLGLAVVTLAMPSHLIATTETRVSELFAVLDSQPRPGTLTVIGSHRT